MRTLRINRSGAIHEVASSQQTAFLAHVVETGVVFGTDKATIKDGNHDASAIIALLMQDINFQLGSLCFCTAIIATEAARAFNGFHFIGHPTFLHLLCLGIVGAIAHHFHKPKGVDSLNHGRIGNMHRNTIQPFRGVEQFSTTVGHCLKILRIHRDVVLINGDAQIGATLQSPWAQVSLGVINRIR